MMPCVKFPCNNALSSLVVSMHYQPNAIVLVMWYLVTHSCFISEFSAVLAGSCVSLCSVSHKAASQYLVCVWGRWLAQDGREALSPLSFCVPLFLLHGIQFCFIRTCNSDNFFLISGILRGDAMLIWQWDWLSCILMARITWNCLFPIEVMIIFKILVDILLSVWISKWKCQWML